MRFGCFAGPRAYPSPKLECTFCGGYYFSSSPLLHNTAAALGIKYAFCPRCGSEKPKEKWTRSWKIRWTKEVQKIAKKFAGEQETE